MNKIPKALCPPVLDACCGSRMFWFNRNSPNAVYMDVRTLDTTLCDGRHLKVSPDIVGAFTDMPFEDETFNLVVFDPPHLIRAGEKSWLRAKYGVLPDDWKAYLSAAFTECFRVLKPLGVLTLKWNSDQIPLKEVLALSPVEPLYGDRRSKTSWVTFIKA